jgi:hypothetical protein
MSLPSSFSEKLADKICEFLSEGQSLVKICQREDMPHRATVLRWMSTNSDFATKVACAREAQGDFVHDEMADIEAKTLAGEIPADVARVVISSKQWRAAKLAPKKYGDKTLIETNARVKVEHTRQLDISTLSDEQLDALEGALRATVAQLAAPVIEHQE